MKCLLGILVLVLINFAASQNQKIDFCLIDISNNLDGRAYPIDNLPELVGPVFKEEFESRIKEDSFKNEFLDTFGLTMEEISTWYYDFEQLGRIDVNRIQSDSLHCLFVYERERFPHIYWKKGLNTDSIINYITNQVFDHIMNEEPMNLRLPLLVFDYHNAIACNFGKMSNEEFLLLHCAHNIMDRETAMTTKVVHKSSKIGMCVSDVPQICKVMDIDIRSNQI